MILKSKIFQSSKYSREDEQVELNNFLLALQTDVEFICFEQIFPRRYDILITYWAKKSTTCDVTPDITTYKNEFSNLTDTKEKECCISKNFCEGTLNKNNLNIKSDFCNFECSK